MVRRVSGVGGGGSGGNHPRYWTNLTDRLPCHQRTKTNHHILKKVATLRNPTGPSIRIQDQAWPKCPAIDFAMRMLVPMAILFSQNLLRGKNRRGQVDSTSVR